VKKKFLGMALSGSCAARAFAESSTTFFGAIDVAIAIFNIPSGAAQPRRAAEAPARKSAFVITFFVEIGRPFNIPGRGEDIVSNRFIPAASISNNL